METIDVETLRMWLEEGQPVTVLDIRPMHERMEWSIPGSIHFDAYDALQTNDPQALADVELSGDIPVVTVCGAGKTSLVAAQQLQARGIEALSLEGGMKAWSLAWNVAEVRVQGSEARVLQVRRTGKGCLSYIIGSAGVAAVIDPALPAEVYLSLAQAQGWRITQVLETHIHADHLSRGRSLAERSNATLLLPKQNRVSFPFTPVHAGETLDIGKVHLEVVFTPGHTPESNCYLLDGKALLTGDTLFLAAVGRPDLHENANEVQDRARTLYRSLQQLMILPSETIILPGHSSEPVAFDGRPVSVLLGQVRGWLDTLSISEDVFVDQIIARLPPTPPNYERIVMFNEEGLLPESDSTELEAGANRCAVA